MNEQLKKDVEGQGQILLERYLEQQDDSVREEIFQCFQPLVKAAMGITRKQYVKQMERQDVVSYAQLGLLEAIDRFPVYQHQEIEEMKEADESNDLCDLFEAYAMLWMRGCIYRGMISFMGTKRTQIQYREQFTILYIEEQAQNHKPIRDPVDRIEDTERQIDAGRMYILLGRGIERLNPIQRKIILKHYFQGETFRQISREERRSHTWILEQHAKALNELKEVLSEDKNLLFA